MEKGEIAAKVREALDVVREVAGWARSATNDDEKHEVCQRVEQVLECLLEEMGAES